MAMHVAHVEGGIVPAAGTSTPPTRDVAGGQCSTAQHAQLGALFAGGQRCTTQHSAVGYAVHTWRAVLEHAISWQRCLLAHAWPWPTAWWLPISTRQRVWHRATDQAVGAALCGATCSVAPTFKAKLLCTIVQSLDLVTERSLGLLMHPTKSWQDSECVIDQRCCLSCQSGSTGITCGPFSAEPVACLGAACYTGVLLNEAAKVV